MASLDIVNLFSHIPAEVTIDLIKHNLIINFNLNRDTINEFFNLLKIVLEHNYYVKRQILREIIRDNNVTTCVGLPVQVMVNTDCKTYSFQLYRSFISCFS